VRLGNRKYAAKLMERAEKMHPGMVGFNDLHKETLKFDTQDMTMQLREISIRKKPVDNGGVYIPVVNIDINVRIWQRHMLEISEITSRYWQVDCYGVVLTVGCIRSLSDPALTNQFA